MDGDKKVKYAFLNLLHHENSGERCIQIMADDDNRISLFGKDDIQRFITHLQSFSEKAFSGKAPTLENSRAAGFEW